MYPLVTLLVTALALEGLARRMDLDARQRQAIRVDRQLLIAETPGAPGAALGVDYLPRGFTLDEAGFTSAWGRCDFDHAGSTALVFGDSVTRQVGLPADPRFQADDPRLTWPALLKRALPAEWQLCVFAEDGYHPADYAAVAEVLVPTLQPELLL